MLRDAWGWGWFLGEKTPDRQTAGRRVLDAADLSIFDATVTGPAGDHSAEQAVLTGSWRRGGEVSRITSWAA